MNMNFNRQDSRPILIALQDQFLIDEIRRRKSSGDMSVSVNGNESDSLNKGRIIFILQSKDFCIKFKD